MRDVPSSRLPTPAIPLPTEAIAKFCRRHYVHRLSLFGSVLRSDFRPESDVDVLVDLEPDAPVGYFEFASMRQELSEILGREVDLHTPAGLSRYIRERVVRDAEPVFARAR